MGDKEVKSKKGFMSRLSSFRKKKSSSKHGSVTSLKSGSGDNAAKGDDGRRMLTDVDRRSKGSSYVSSSQNSLEGINGRTRSTSDLIAGYEKRLSLLKDDNKPAAQAVKRSSATNSTSSQESESSLRVTSGISTNADSVKGHGQTSVQPALTHKSGMKPYRSVFTDVTKGEGKVLNSLEKTEDTTQTNFSQVDPGEEDVARLVKVQSSRTPETKRAHLSIARQNIEASSSSNYRPLVGKETYIGPDPITPGKGVDESRLRFRSTSTPMPKSSEVVVEPTTSPISTSNDLVPTHIPHTDGREQVQSAREIDTSFRQSSIDSTRRERNVSSFVTQQGSKRTERDVWTKQEPISDIKSPPNLLEESKGSNMTFTKTPSPQNTTMPSHQTRGQTVTTVVNRTVVVEKGTTRTPSKDLAGRTFSVESNCADSIGSDDLMCDSKFTGLEETTFPDSDTTIETHRPIRDVERNRSRNQWRKGSEAESISSSLPSSSSPLSSPSRVKLNSAEKDSCVVLDAVVYNGMVKELSAMRLMLRKLSTLLHEEKVIKTRTSESQYDPRWNKCDQDTQTEISELLDAASSVSVAAVQCNLRPEKLTCGSQYEKPRELPKPSKIAAPASKLTKPRTTQHSSKENGPAAQPSQMTKSEKSYHPPDEECDGVTGGEEDGDEEKRDDMKGSDCTIVTNKNPEFSSVEIKVKDVHSSDLSKTSPRMDRKTEISNRMTKLSKDLPKSKEGGIDTTTGVAVLPQRGVMKILSDSDNGDNRNSLSEELETLEILKGKESEIEEKGDDGMEVGETQTGKPRSNSNQGKTGKDKTTADREDKHIGIERSEMSSKSDEDDTQEGTNEVGENGNSIQGQLSPKSNSPSKLSKLQPYKTTNLRYSQTVKTVKTEKISYSSGSNPARPQGGLRPPQWSKTEKVSKTDHQSSLKSSEKPSELHRMDNNIPKPNNPSQLPPTKKLPTNENAALSSKNAKTEPGPATKDSTAHGGFSGSRPTGAIQPSKLQRPQSVCSQSKLTAPASYSNLAQRKSIERAPEGTLSDSSDGRSLDDNGNSSTGSSAENINVSVRSNPGVTKTSGSRLPKVKQTSRLPRGRGIPRMNPR